MMKFIAFNILLINCASATYGQIKSDSIMLFLKNLNKKIITEQKKNNYVKYDFKFGDIDSFEKKENTFTGSVAISKLKTGTSYVIKYNEADRVVLASSGGLLTVNNKENKYSKIDSADKNLLTAKYKNTEGLALDFLWNSGISFIYSDSFNYEGVIKENNKYLYSIQHIYNPKLVNMKETVLIDTSSLFTLKKIYKYPTGVDGSYSISTIDFYNISFDKIDAKLFDETTYTNGKIKEEESKGESLALNSKAPSINGIDINTNKQFDETKIKNKSVILDFWFIDCYPCRKAHSILEKINLKYQDKGLIIIGADNKDELEKIKTYLSKNNSGYPNIKVDKELVNRFKVSLYPTIVCID